VTGIGKSGGSRDWVPRSGESGVDSAVGGVSGGEGMGEGERGGCGRGDGGVAGDVTGVYGVDRTRIG
jgi:hypothetical protein